jgi:hypothetical protein
VPFSSSGGRAVVTGLQGGNEVGDHHVRGRVVVEVVAGRVWIDCPEETAECETATPATSDPGEHRTVLALDVAPPPGLARAITGRHDGCRPEPGVASDPAVGTFAAPEVKVGTRRCAGGSFQLSTGKAPAESRYRVTLGFKTSLPQPVGPGAAAPGPVGPDEPAFEFSCAGVISICFPAREPGTAGLAGALLGFRHAGSCTVANEPGACERLIRGDTLFTRASGIERLREVSAPLPGQRPEPLPCARGSRRPHTIGRLVAAGRWHLPDTDTENGWQWQT